MSRYPAPDLNALPDDIKAKVLEVQEKAGFVPNVFLAFARRPAEWRELMLRAMQADNSWASSARRYAELYRRAIALRQAERTGPA